jgi:sirohydrochlorin ferrochelatase
VFGVLNGLVGSPTVGEIFLYLAGAVVGFVVVEAAVTDLFRDRVRSDAPEVVAIGGAFAFASVGSSLGVAALIAEVVDSGVAWLAAPFGATVTYLLVVGIEMRLAHRAEEAGAGSGEEG